MSEAMVISNAKYVASSISNENEIIHCVIDGTESNVPLAPGNRHYDEIQRQVAAGTLTIADAD